MTRLRGYDASIMLIDQADREIERRQQLREGGPAERLTDVEVGTLYELHSRGASLSQLASEVGCTRDTIRRGFRRLGLPPLPRPCGLTREGATCDLPAGHPGFHHWRGMA